MNTATLNGHRKGMEGFINLNPTEEQLDIEKMEDSITLDDSTKEKILNKHRKRVAKKEIKNAEIKATIEGKELEQRLEAAKTGSLSNAFNEQKKQILKLLQASFLGTIIFLFVLPTILSFLHGYSIAAMAERLGGKFLVAYIFGIGFAGLFESLMLGQVLQFNHRAAKFTMYSAMSVLAIITSVEIFKRGLDFLQITDLTRAIGGIALLPIVKSFVAKIRDKAEKEGKNHKKLLFEKLPEDIQKSIIKDLIFLQGELAKLQAIPTKTETVLDKKTGKMKTITRREKVFKVERFSFPEYSNAKGILEHSLRKKIVEYKVYTNVLWKQLKSNKANKPKNKTEKPVNEHPENK